MPSLWLIAETRGRTVVALCFLVFVTSAVMGDESKPTSRAAVRLEVVPVLDAPAGRVQLVLTNNSSVAVGFTDVLTNDNWLVVTNPSGKTTKIITYSGPDADNLVVAAGQHKSWEVDLLRLFDLSGLAEAGIYRVQWELFKDGWCSEPIHIARSAGR
jgi:hypothetical protein